VSARRALEHRPGGDRVGGRGDAGQLDPDSLQHLLEPLDRPRPLVDLRFAQPGQVAQAADLRRRHEARPDEPVLDQLADPGGVDRVGLPPGDVVQMLRIEQPALETALKHIEHRLPVDAGRLHPDQRHAEALQPLFQFL
jgi:hypothetical protein